MKLNSYKKILTSCPLSFGAMAQFGLCNSTYEILTIVAIKKRNCYGFTILMF